ncbi:MAG: hypothetical protein N2049_07500 [Anaerolineales bacterium]|nr:hypothetical protein [Anaerolineales bacterium]
MTKSFLFMRSLSNLLPILPRILPIIFGVILAIFIPLHYFQPFPSYWNYQTGYILISLAASITAILGLGWALTFEQGEPPRRIWKTFAAGWIVWMVGEFLTIIYTFLYPKSADFTWMDPFWLGGYFLFSLALYYQYTLIFANRKGRWIYLSIIILLLVISLGLTTAAQRSGFAEADIPSWVLFISISYPLIDIVLGLAALGLLFIFGQGQLAKPWRGMVSFAIADAINIFLWAGGEQALPYQVSHILYLVSDIFYLFGYMLAAWGFLSLLSLVYLKHHPIASNA